jgi:hypothetical protein
MGDPETASEDEGLPEPELAGTPIGDRKVQPAEPPITDPDVPELQDRRRPRP